MREDVWLGQRLGRAAWTVEGQDPVGEIGARDPGFFQAKVPTDRVARVGELEDAGFRTIDANITLRREPGPPGPAVPESRGNVRHARPEDREAVAEIAARDYSVSRFHLDPQIPDALAVEIKRDWVDNFFGGGRGDQLLVAESGGEVVGFLLVLALPEASVVDLIAVSERARGKGTGRALVSTLVQSRPDGPVLGGTQVSNLGALRFYTRLGFSVERTQFVLHRHG
jgi:ribosomal protein S18 acetylase RimI-like enzyme